MENYIIYQSIFAPLRLIGNMWPMLAVFFFFSVIMHEVAHGYAAMRSGDDTARLMGRLTLNPIPHIDLIGTILVPAFLIISRAGVIFGWAKPVPINPYNFRNIKEGMIKVSLAGVLTNFAIATALSILVYIINLTGLHTSALGGNIIILFTATASVNIILGLFNLVPIPPLDGSNLLSTLLPDDMAQSYEKIKPYGFFIIIFLLFTGILWGIISLFGNLFYRFLFMGLPL
ncbi:MAG: site-2 protease family protein [Elusimicrobiota bacterium]